MRTFFAIIVMETIFWVEGFAEKLTGIDYEVPDHGVFLGALFMAAFCAMILQDYREITRKETRISFNHVNEKKDVSL